MIAFPQNLRTRRFATVGILLMTLSVLAFAAAAGDEQPQYTLTGRVIDAKTKAPVQRYELVVLAPTNRVDPREQPSEMSRTQVDDRGGKFRLSALPGALIRVLADQFLPAEVLVAESQGPLEIALQPGIRFRGIVASVQGPPLPEVAVTYRASSPLQGGWFERKTRTDTKGAYEITLAPGDSFIVFDKEGFVREEVSFTVNEKMSSRDVTLHPAVSLRGRVLDDLGQPVPQARVRASWLTRSGVLKDVITDDQGRFSLTELRRGPYKFEVSKASYATSLRSSIDLPALEDLTIRLDRGATVTGIVTGIAEEEKPYIFIYLNETMTAANIAGKYGIRGVPPGPTTVVAEFASEGKLKRSSTKQVNLVNGATTEVNLAFREEKGVRGRVLEGDTPATRAVVELTPEVGRGRTVRVAVAEGGSFEILGLDSGSYQLAVPGHKVLSEKRVKIEPGAELSVKVQRDPQPDQQGPMRPAAPKSPR